MSSSAPRRSVDNPASPRPSSSSSQYPFPQYDTPQRSGGSGRYSGRRGSGASSVTSIGGILDPATQGGNNTIAETGSNAISTLLQPPIVRTGLSPHTAGLGAQKPPSTKDIPPVTLTNIPHIEPSAFQSYVSQAGSLYEAFRRAKENNDEAAIAHGRRSRTSSKTDSWVGLLGQNQRRYGSVPSTPMLEAPSVPTSPLESPQAKRKTGGGTSRRGPLPVTPLSTIPNVYFEDDFHLENPRTFDIVSERSEIARQPGATGSATAPGSSGRKALATNAILQEKLSWYMDTVEVHLISSISTASTSFFAALGSLRQLHTEASESVDKIKTLRQDLGTLDRDMAAGGLKVVAMRRRRENVRKLGAAVAQLREVVEAVARCEDQVDKGDNEIALQGLDDVERLIAGERATHGTIRESDDSGPGSVLIDLRGIAALDGSANDLAYLRRKIGKGFESRFLEALLGDLRSHVENVQTITTLQRWDKASQRARGVHTRTPSVFPSYLQLDDTLRAALRSHLDGLARSNCVPSATNAYRESILREVKNLIRKHLPSSSDDDAESTMSASTQGGRHMTQQERSSILARNLRALDASDAEDMLKKIYSNVGEALRRLSTQVKVLLDLTSGIRSPPTSAEVKSPSTSMDSYANGLPNSPRLRTPVPEDDIQQALDMSSILGQAVDAAQTQVTKILKVRQEQCTRLPLNDFLRYFYLNKLFADECEAVSGRGGVALKTVVSAHIKDFVTQYGNRERQVLIERMDLDRWDAQDFTESDSATLAQILEASTRDIEAWANACQLWPVGEHSANVTANGEEQKANGEMTNGAPPTKEKIRSVLIDEQKYILPESAMTVLAGIRGFEQLITGIPSMTQEITSSLLEYLKLFNSRSSQLILGAGATRSAGLKNITTKHLALASQALSFVATLTPHVREFVRRRCQGSGSLMTEFDKVKRLYQEHQSGINDKLVDLMSGRAGTHVTAMKKINWDDPNNSPAVNPYMDALVKETSTLHKVLSKHLPEMTVRTIMDPVFTSYREQWEKGFGEIGIKTVGGKQRIFRDVEFFRSRISKLDGAAGLGEYLVRIVEKKAVGGSSTDAPRQPNPDGPDLNGLTTQEKNAGSG